MIDFENAKILDYSHSHEFLGSLFKFGCRKNISIEGEIYQLDNFNGVSGIWSGINNISSSAQDYDDIVLNGVSFGKGRVESLSFDAGIDVRRKSYRASLTVFDTGNLFNMSGEYYSGINDIPVPFHLLESFSENFSANISEQKNGSLTQDISIRFVSGAATGGVSNPIEMAKLLASGLLNSTAGTSLIFNKYPWLKASARKYATESYNEITNDCKFSFSQEVSSGAYDYGFSYTNSLNTDENGFCNVREQGEVIGYKEKVYDSAVVGYNIESANSYARCNSLYTSYGINNEGGLRAFPISSSRTNDHFAGTISYSIEYSDNLKYNNGYSWSYNQDIKKTDGCFYEVSEQGDVVGLLINCTGNKYSNALSGWAIVQTGISGRVYDYYNDATSLTRSLKLNNRSISSDVFGGAISYNNSYSDNPNSNISGFKRIDLNISYNEPVHLANKLPIPNVGEVVQPAYISTVGEKVAQLNIVGYKTHSINDYTNIAKSILNSHIPSGEDVYISSAPYSLSPTTNQFNISCSWKYFESRAFTDYTV